jgi:hypothetical protein
MPDDPKRLQVIDRVVDVLKDITEGTDYFFTARQVAKGFVAEPIAYPVYMVRSESGGDIEMHSDAQFSETFYLSISGRVQEIGDVVTPMERALRDVRKAIEADFQPAAGTGSLIEIATAIVFTEPPEIMYDVDATGPFAEFSQRVRITIDGEFGEL